MVSPRIFSVYIILLLKESSVSILTILKDLMKPCKTCLAS